MMQGLRLAPGLVVTLAVLALAAPSWGVTPMSSASECGALLFGTNVPVTGQWTDQPLGPDVSQGTPQSPVLEEVVVDTLEQAFQTTCRVSVNTAGPVITTELDFQGFGHYLDRYLRAWAPISTHFVVQEKRPGGPSGRVPLRFKAYLFIDAEAGIGSVLQMTSNFQVGLNTPGSTLSLVQRVGIYQPPLGPPSTCTPPCEELFYGDAFADVGVEYAISSSQFSFFTEFQSYPDPVQATGSTTTRIQTEIYIHPLASQNGMFWSDYYEVVMSDNVRPVGVTRTHPPGLNNGDVYHLLFVTSDKRDAVSADIEVYNTFVNDAADFAGIGPNDSTERRDGPLQWFAVGSTNAIDARDNAQVTAPVYRLDGTLLATGAADFWDGALLAPPLIDERGLFLTVDQDGITGLVFTGSAEDGTADQPLGALVSTYGEAEVTDDRWMDAGGFDSITERHYYAISEPITVVPEPRGRVASGAALGSVGALAALRRRRRNAPAT